MGFELQAARRVGDFVAGAATENTEGTERELETSPKRYNIMQVHSLRGDCGTSERH
jgi:hypothetical protein